ncbi:MAG: 30S ribosomal protein S3ae [Candidatus Bathyarchaeota archaeon]|nr:30S ribosomal protein S3ae [Candidatus Bathyarchaeota archaeon]
MSRRRRRVQDKWRMKEWYDISSPAYFGGKMIASVPASSAENMIGRTIEATLYDITGDFSQQHVKLYFQVTRLKGTDADTVFKGHEYTGDYLRSLVRRGNTRIDCIVKLTTKGGYNLRVSVVAFSVLRVRKSQILSVRKIMRRILHEKAETLFFDQFVQEAVLGKIASDIYNEAKKIIPLRHTGIRKSKLLSYPTEVDADVAAEVEVTA